MRQALPASGPQTIELAGAWSQWDGVQPEFLDDLNDDARRDHAGYNNHCRYRNDSGRNDLTRLRVAGDRESVFFYAETRAPLSPWTGTHWMELLLDVDGRRDSGWEGYDFMVNGALKSATTTTLQHWSGTAWEAVADLPLRVEDNRLMLVVPRRLLGVADSARLQLDFKWADNRQSEAVTEFTVNGDAAPNGRFNYRYQSP